MNRHRPLPELPPRRHCPNPLHEVLSGMAAALLLLLLVASVALFATGCFDEAPELADHGGSGDGSSGPELVPQRTPSFPPATTGDAETGSGTQGSGTTFSGESSGDGPASSEDEESGTSAGLDWDPYGTCADVDCPLHPQLELGCACTQSCTVDEDCPEDGTCHPTALWCYLDCSEIGCPEGMLCDSFDGQAVCVWPT